MSMLLYILLGLVSGFGGGALGLGGGAIMVPALVLLFGLTQHQAQGTALAVMLPPVFILGVMQYYYAGNIKIKMAIFIAIGFIVGAYLGAQYVQNIPSSVLKKAFGIFMIIIGIKMVFLK